MQRTSRYLSAVLVLITLAISSGMPVLPASAADTDAGSSGLTIQPRKNYIINPGQTIDDKISIGNLDNNNDLYLSLRIIDFTYTNESGTPKLNLAENASATPWSLQPFMKIPSTVTVGKSSTQTISYSITIPKNQGAGGYYSAIYYQARGSSGGNVALNASGVSLVFVSVPGNVSESLTLQKLGAYNSTDNGATGSYVYIDANQQPQMVAFAVKNAGNVFESPAGEITINDMFGHQVADIPTNTNQSLALLGQTRLFTSCIKTIQQKIKLEGGTSTDTSCTNPGLRPGLYTAKLDVFYGQNGSQTHEITGTAHFWYLPWWFIITVLVILLLLAYGIWRLQRKVKSIMKGTAYKAGRGISRRGNKK